MPLHDELEAFEGVLALLPELRAEGRRLGLVTAKRHASVMLAFDRFPGLEEQFDVVVGHDDTERHKPDPAPILHAVERLGVDPSQAAYVGDSPFDIQAARAAGSFAIAVGWGGIHSLERLAEERPDALVSTPEELADVL